MATCCGIIVFTVWELIAIVAGLVALATNAWIVPNNPGTACILGIQGAGLWTVCTGKGTALTNCEEVLSSGGGTSNASETGQNIVSQIESIPEQIQSPSSWIFTSNDECTPINDQTAVMNYYSSLPVGATDAKDYTLFVQSTRGLVACFCGLGFFTILALAAHKPGRGAAAGCSHFMKSLQISAGICAIGVFIGMLSGISGSQDFVWDQFGASLEAGWTNVANMWGWSWWVFVGAVGWAILGWIVMCITFCCSGRSEKY
ncbi:hypothetical protein HOP50_12g67480 [Chloropicon primus]|uniref:Claudin n=1 Tax=Chloropicon primus TaxID=1764295 RepID=A0A5B8MV69_9CHLO|nr:hypothetical protein A3770_12p67290 [Chloropicon primus]UPR03419.1 hypothetical protein HOP50_12g67480 [Chloropicon primus]|mmetsp:Transcript_3059/g.8345  ORF Transcript_3059/g.8345 Transcript_3059/m.8345 type:complete len:259 (-) Transcript_3059:82-858(-)|eukprot:QDZ24211.1 hypothetical protein A3770_12p67290 [Chloropicon primus]